MSPFRKVQRKVFSWAFPQHRELTEDERNLTLRVATVVAVPFALIVLLAVIGAGLVAWHYTQADIRDNRAAVAEAEAANAATRRLALDLNAERRTRERALAWQVFDECVENENQDAVNAGLFRKVYALVAQGPPTQARDTLLDGLQQAIDAREPPGEKDCVAPAFPRPKEAR